MSIIESTGNRHVGTNYFGYTGLMQMGRTAAADVGMSYSSLVGSNNVENNAMAGAKYWNVNDKRLDKSVPRDPLHMYLAHQQGAGGGFHPLASSWVFHKSGECWQRRYEYSGCISDKPPK